MSGLTPVTSRNSIMPVIGAATATAAIQIRAETLKRSMPRVSRPNRDSPMALSHLRFI